VRKNLANSVVIGVCQHINHRPNIDKGKISFLFVLSMFRATTLYC